MTLFIAWLWGIANPTKTAILKVLIIVFGVVIASIGEIRISWIGVFYQVAGLVFESTRLVMIQVLLSDDGEKMDPLVSLYYFAPVCGAMNLVVVYFTEAGSFHLTDFQNVGIFFLILNAMVAFCLNIASVFLVSYLCCHFSPPPPTTTKHDSRSPGVGLAEFTDNITDWKNKQSRYVIVQHFQGNLAGSNRRSYMGHPYRLAANVWLPHCPSRLISLFGTHSQNHGVVLIYTVSFSDLDARRKFNSPLLRGYGTTTTT